MKIAVLADDAQWNELQTDSPANQWYKLHSLDELNDERMVADCSAFFILTELTNYSGIQTNKPVLINLVNGTLTTHKLPLNFLRINGWHTFLSRANWEIAGVVTEQVEQIFQLFNKTFTIVKDEPGFIAARVIAMIINEAYFALGEKVSTRSEIDIAMKLGTNYPYGPFEWSEKIGVSRICSLLQILADADKRYTPAPLLLQETLI